MDRNKLLGQRDSVPPFFTEISGTVFIVSKEKAEKIG